jgi:hypothetical protein
MKRAKQRTRGGWTFIRLGVIALWMWIFAATSKGGYQQRRPETEWIDARLQRWDDNYLLSSGIAGIFIVAYVIVAVSRDGSI